MKRFEFRLDRVLHYKERREQQAELEEQRLAAALNVQDGEISALERRLKQLAEDWSNQSARALDLTAWLNNARGAERLQRELITAQARRLQTLQALQAAAVRRRQAALEAEALRQLRRRRKDQHEAAAAKAEQVQLDEISLRRWQNEIE